MKRILVNFRMNKKEKAELRKKADEMKMSLSAYIRYLSTLRIESKAKE